MTRLLAVCRTLAWLFGGMLVILTVGCVGFAIDRWQGLAWAVGGACAWAIAFALGAHETRRPIAPWSLLGGLLCGLAWSFTWPIAHELEIYQALHAPVMTPAWILAWAIPAGIGGGLLGGVALTRHGTALGVVVGLALGFGATLALIQEPVPFAGPRLLGWLFGLVGAVIGIPIGLRLGRWGRPALFVFEDLAPYLREMAIPFAGFVVGYISLVVAFAGFFGALWRLSGGAAISGMPADAAFIDFVHASVGIATGTGTALTPESPLAKTLVSIEAVFAQGWLIAVFAAVGAHLSPRFSRLAAPSAASDQLTVGTSIPDPDMPSTSRAVSQPDRRSAPNRKRRRRR